MAAALLQDALALAEAAASVGEAAAALRARFAPMRVVVVDASDMRDEKPAAKGARWALFLGASDGHCWSLTHDPAQATGFIVTAREAA